MGLISPTPPAPGQPRGTQETNVRTSLATIVSAINGGLDYSNLAATVDQYYKTILDVQSFDGGLVVGTYVFTVGNLVAITVDGSAYGVIYLDPAHYPSGTRTPKLRLETSALVNGTAPGINYTYGLYPVTAVGGPSTPRITTLGAVVAGSTVATSAPGVGSLNHGETASDFSFPAAGFYAIGVASSGSQVAASQVTHRARLRFRAT